MMKRLGNMLDVTVIKELKIYKIKGNILSKLNKEKILMQILSQLKNLRKNQKKQKFKKDN